MEKNDGNQLNPNSRTIEILQGMASYYDRTGDRWRTLSYRKGITALRKQKDLVRTKEDAIKIPGIGDRLADKIEEIVTTDRLRRLEDAQSDPNDAILQLFMGVYDVGLRTASTWIAQGHHTLEDLLQHVDLTYNQRVGIEHYSDFNQRIPRSEVAQHGEIVKRALLTVDPQLELIIGGSYRRGNADSGDIDCLITKKNASMDHVRTLVVGSVIPLLQSQKFLKVALAAGSSRDASKWHGASCLPGSTIWRRIDLLYVPWESLGAALIYFTGNDIFNRSMRLLASRKGWRLNQHGLYKDVMRGEGRKKITDGTLIEGHSEMRIFDVLGVPWRLPCERKC